MSRLGSFPALLSVMLLTSMAEMSHAQWVQTSGPKGGSVRSLLAVPNGTGGTRLFRCQIHVWRTEDDGTSWTLLDNGLNDPNPNILLAVPNGSGGNDILLGTNAGVFRSTDNGASWAPMNTGITNLSIYSLALGPNGSGGT